jgi:hypothetical protein
MIKNIVPTKRWQLVSLLTAVSLLSACAAPYQAAPTWGASGYSSKDLDRNTVQVDYLSGSGSSNALSTYVMYRSAEIALERGYEAFKLVDMSGFSSAGSVAYSSSASAKIFLLNRSPEELAQARTQAAKMPKTSLMEVGIFQKGVVYTAKEVKAKLGPRVLRK